MLFKNIGKLVNIFKEHWQLATTFSVAIYTFVSLLVCKYIFQTYGSDYSVYLDFSDIYWLSLRVIGYEVMSIIVVLIITLSVLIIKFYNTRLSNLKKTKNTLKEEVIKLDLLLNDNEKLTDVYSSRFKADADPSVAFQKLSDLQHEKDFISGLRTDIQTEIENIEQKEENAGFKDDLKFTYFPIFSIITFAASQIFFQVMNVGDESYFSKNTITVNLNGETQILCGRVIIINEKHVVSVGCNEPRKVQAINKRFVVKVEESE